MWENPVSGRIGSVQSSEEEVRTVPFGAGLVFGIASLVFGVIILVFPKILNYLIGIYLIIVGLIAILA